MSGQSYPTERSEQRPAQGPHWGERVQPWPRSDSALCGSLYVGRVYHRAYRPRAVLLGAMAPSARPLQDRHSYCM